MYQWAFGESPQGRGVIGDLRTVLENEAHDHDDDHGGLPSYVNVMSLMSCFLAITRLPAKVVICLYALRCHVRFSFLNTATSELLLSP